MRLRIKLGLDIVWSTPTVTDMVEVKDEVGMETGC